MKLDIQEWLQDYAPYLISFATHGVLLAFLWMNPPSRMISLRASLGDMSLELIGTSGGEGGKAATQAKTSQEGRDRLALARQSPRSGQEALFRDQQDPEGDNKVKALTPQKPDPFASENSRGRDKKRTRSEQANIGAFNSSALAGAKGPLGGGSPYQRYIQNLYDHLENNKYYPMSARRLHLQGSVEVSFRVKRDGSIEDLKIITPSTSRILNQAALKTVQDIQGKWPLPSHYPAEAMEFQLTFDFSID